MSQTHTHPHTHPCTDHTEVTLASDDDYLAWDSYVKAHPRSTFFHRFGWLHLVSKAYGYRSYGLIARRNGVVCGLLPLVHLKSPLTGSALISTGFTVGGGPLSDDDQSETALLKAAIDLGHERNVDYIELRGAPIEQADWQVKSGVNAQFELQIPGEREQLLTSIPRKRRAEIRKAIALQENGALSLSDSVDADRFFALYASALRDLGTPVFPKKYLIALIDTFRDDLVMTSVLHEGKPVVSLVSFRHKACILPYYIGALPEARALRAFDLCYWHLLDSMRQAGMTLCDFGRSKVDSGPYAYKKTWGMTPNPLNYSYYMNGDEALPDISAVNPKFALATCIWKKLPVPVATAGGALLARHFA